MSALDEVIKDINKTAKANIINFGIVRGKVRKIKFTSPRLNYMLYGGLPRGRVIEFFGAEGGGKSTSALDIVKNAQHDFIIEHNAEIAFLESMPENEVKPEHKSRLNYLQNSNPLKAVYIDCENALDEEWAKTLGVDIDNLIVLRPQQETAETIFQYAIDLMETGEVGLVVLDSIGSLISEQAYEKKIEEKTYGGISRPLTVFSQKLVLLCEKYGITFIGINQIREDLGATYANAYTTPGGKAWKHACSVRIEFRKGYFINEKNERLTNAESIHPAGNVVDVALKKVKTCKPDRLKGMFTINYTSGIQFISDLIDICLTFDICTQRGSYFNFYDENNEVRTYEDRKLSFQGKYSLYSFLSENPDFLNELKADIDKKIGA